jgi:hypothetical protein
LGGENYTFPVKIWKNTGKNDLSIFLLYLNLGFQIDMSGEPKDKKENRTMSNLEKFLTSYGNYVNENTTINMDVDSVLNDIATNIL